MANDNSCEEIIAVNESKDKVAFDKVMGYLEGIILSEEFVCIRDTFFDDHCKYFSYEEENKLEYTTIFEKYVDLLEGFIEAELRDRDRSFDMTLFMKELEDEAKKNNLQGDIIDLLTTFTDFTSFKNSMLDAKKAKETEGEICLSDLLCIKGFQ